MADIDYCEADAECVNLFDNKGLSGESDDCTDLNNLNDCLIGSEIDNAEISDVCDWRDYTKGLVTNLWTVLKAIICSICGLWNKVNEINLDTERIDCIIGYMGTGYELEIGEEPTDGSYVVAGKGVSFLKSGSGTRESEIVFRYIGGSMVLVQGSLNFYGGTIGGTSYNTFTDNDYCYSFDDGGATPVYRQNRKGNSVWLNNDNSIHNMAGGGELIYEIRISKEQYPEIEQIYPGPASPTGGGMFQCNMTVFDEGEMAYGQSGEADTKHLVPDGWVYVQVRMCNIGHLISNGGRYSPRGYMGIRFNTDEIIC